MTRRQSLELRAAIHDILWNEWDPIGVNGYSESDDEYDSYIPGIAKLLACRADEISIERHLNCLEMQSMGLPARDCARRQRVAHLLRQLEPET